MLYDYILTQFYPMIPFYVAVSFIMISCVSLLYFMKLDFMTDKEKESFKTKYRKKFYTFISCNLAWLLFISLLPDSNYIKHYFGDVRQLTQQQRIDINKHLEQQYKKSEKLFIDCLDKGQKQPDTTVFNDTNEVVKTCYKVAKYKF